MIAVSTLVAFAGLPGTGKSTLARALAERTGAPVLDKDRVRAALFGPRHVSYTREQDDLVVRLLLQAVEHLFAAGTPLAILDGRTFTRAGDVDDLRAFARAAEARLVLVECFCTSEVARARLAADAAGRAHPAANRTAELHDRLAASAEPIVGDAVRIDTSLDPPPVEALHSVLAALRSEVEQP